MMDTEITIAKKLLDNYALCDHCLGRQFRHIQPYQSNKNRGQSFRTQLKREEIPIEECYLCEGLINDIDHFTQIIHDMLKSYEYTTFLIGSKIDEEIQQKEQQIHELLSDSETAEPLKMEINRSIGKQLETQLNKTVAFINPDITVIVDTGFDLVHLQIQPLYLYGRYKKYKRGIPQTKWPCYICRGVGCKECNNTGRLYMESVEDLVAQTILQQTKATDASFHGCGREDIDALMLGNGRPFILEVKNPQIRTIDLSHLEQEINKRCIGKIGITHLKYTQKEDIARIKNAEFIKTYRVLIQGKTPFIKEKLKEGAQILGEITIKQFTPTRVAHRRAKKVREKQIYSCIIDSVEDSLARLTIETQSGTYIKELVSGDQGRTQPNLSDLIGIPCTVTELDVVEIKGE